MQGSFVKGGGGAGGQHVHTEMATRARQDASAGAWGAAEGVLCPVHTSSARRSLWVAHLTGHTHGASTDVS